MYSSGTSGLPKGGVILGRRCATRLTRCLAVMVSHRNVIASLMQVAVAAEFEGPNPLLEVRASVSIYRAETLFAAAKEERSASTGIAQCSVKSECKPSSVTSIAFACKPACNRLSSSMCYPLSECHSFMCICPLARHIHWSRSLSCPCITLTACITGASAPSSR